jgi:hypothetical protein
MHFQVKNTLKNNYNYTITKILYMFFLLCINFNHNFYKTRI